MVLVVRTARLIRGLHVIARLHDRCGPCVAAILRGLNRNVARRFATMDTGDSSSSVAEGGGNAAMPGPGRRGFASRSLSEIIHTQRKLQYVLC